MQVEEHVSGDRSFILQINNLSCIGPTKFMSFCCCHAGKYEFIFVAKIKKGQFKLLNSWEEIHIEMFKSFIKGETTPRIYYQILQWVKQIC